ncbi:hypothetical protein F4820DRAFT_233657 [Hypoxylon rubiginosum]|uniref:Uncharacterized protein n=1 Tax=Hypoxylon rubiginosum TaxID=110542 RepID=A0ACB9YHJ8_9PEZI|nr:hypothetical protein F4820DRAFT_233657 [Hypoxylon rubiginosum]
MTAQAEQHSQHAKSLLNVLSDTSVTLAAIGKHASHIKRTIARLCHFIQDIQKILIFLSTCTEQMLEAIRRNT